MRQNEDRSTNMNRNRNQKRGSRKRKSGKQVEVDVQGKDINLADLPHVLTNSKAANDPQWYMNIPTLSKDYASLPFSLPAGLPTGVMDGSTASGLNYLPGIMTIAVAPTVGNAQLPTDGINVAAQQLYTMVRKANSGAVNYDKTDLMMLIMAMDSAYMVYEYLLRIYRCLGSYNYMNRYQPNMLLHALGGSQSLSASLADFRGALDLFAYKLASINVPDVLDVIRRHSWLFSHVYSDAANAKAQMYAYVPYCFYKWTEGTGSTPTSLTGITPSTLFNFTNGVITSVEDIINGINTIMDPLLGSQDVGVISGDIAKAYGDGAMIKIRPVGDYEALQPIYDKEVLLQMSNTYITPYGTYNNFSIVPDNSDLVAGPFLKQNFTMSTMNLELIEALKNMKPLLNFIDIEPTPENVMVATRMFTGYNGSEQEDMLFGTEIPISIKIYTMQSSGAPSTRTYRTHEVLGVAMQPSDGNTNSTSLLNNIGLLLDISAFDWAPPVYQWISNIHSGSQPTGTRMIGTTIDYCNYTPVDYNSLRQMHEVAVMSEFTVKNYSMAVK